ncbi:hypothetical protein ACTFIW_012886 [Dictyostelium discoideum]
MRGILILLLLFIFSTKIINSQNPLIESEYNCTIKLLNIISRVSVEYGIDSSFNGYNFCGISIHPMDIVIACNETTRTVRYIRATHKNKANLLSPDHFQCYSTLNTINIDKFRVTNQFLLGKFPESLKTVSLLDGDSTLFNIDSGVNKTIPFSNLTVKLFLSGPLNIYLSNLLNLIDFSLSTKTLSPKYKINYINDINDHSIITDNQYFKVFRIYTHSIPSMDNFKGFTLQFILLPGTDINSFSNFSTYSKIEGLYLKSADPSHIYPFPIALTKIPISINKNTGFSFEYQIEKPIDYIDLSNYSDDSVVEIYIAKAGNLFNINGNFPFSVLPPNLNSFQLTNGNISVINFNIFKEETNVIYLSFNGLTGKLPTSSFIKSMDASLEIYLNDNRLTGEMDDSWCSIIFDISNNLIGGKAPSCVVCHYLSPITSTIVNGNMFTNLDISNLEDCTTIELNLSYDNETKSLMLYGRDLGFGTFKLDNPNIWAKYTIIQNTLFEITKNNRVTGPMPKGFNITFPYLPQGPRTFEITAYNEFIPQIDSVIRYSDYFIVNGKYFAYNNTVINVLISNEPCLVLSSNFNQIQCYLYNSNKIINNNNSNTDSSSSSSIEINCLVQVMNVSNSFNFTVNEICNGINCPIPVCNIKNGGAYNKESGVCDCFSNEWRGYQCEQKPLKCSSDCSNDDGGGICNNINGKCECNENRIFDDCSGRLCNEGLGCSNGGICDYLFGQCNCTIQWTASNCNIPNTIVTSQEIKRGALGNLLILNGWFGSEIFRNDLTIKVNQIECDIAADSDYMVECYPSDIYCYQYNNNNLELSVVQNNVHWSGFYNPTPLGGVSVCINNGSSGSSSSSSNSSSSNSSGNDINGENKEDAQNPKFSRKNILILISILIPSVILLILLVLIIKSNQCKVITRKIFKDKKNFTELEETDIKFW